MYKASEYKAWILFYALPVLSLFLPLQFSRHLSLLVCALHILLSDRVVVKELDIMLSNFYQRAGDLYNQSIYTINMHSLEHIVAFFKLWGPLWSYSMFGFENLNGYIGKCIMVLVKLYIKCLSRYNLAKHFLISCKN